MCTGIYFREVFFSRDPIGDYQQIEEQNENLLDNPDKTEVAKALKLNDETDEFGQLDWKQILPCGPVFNLFKVLFWKRNKQN